MSMLLIAPTVALAKPQTLGWLEWSWLEPGAVKIKTKLDTGAKTSSIHAANIVPFERDGVPWVRFQIPLANRSKEIGHVEYLSVERVVERETRIKDHYDESRERYVVKLDMCIGGTRFSTPVTLADRGRFNYPLLLGRLALRGRILVDAERIFTASQSCDS
ncbi:MAG: ATP-dependent zinc protease [Proteobacteria bacterium]|nr:ATP-dependent zinc protease [Pseudomonadota bacterium]